MDSKVGMEYIVILLTLLLGLCDAARRTTNAIPTATTSTGRHIGRNQQQRQELENAWDLVDLQKLDNHANIWSHSPSSFTNVTESQDSEVVNSRQSYPGFPNPGDTNELPGPISPGPITVKPTPIFTPPPGCYAPRGQFPSPKSCANYLNCWDDVVTEQSCPDGLLFNDVTLVCDFDYNVNCGSRALPTPKPALPAGSKLCPEPNGRYRSATNCSEFYVCVYRKPIKFGCPRGLVYNDVPGVCDYPYNVDCKGASTPSLPPQPTSPQMQSPTSSPQQPTYPSVPSYRPPSSGQQPSYGPSQPSGQQPPYGPSQPSGQQPSYGPSQPSGQQPSYGPSQPSGQQPSYGPSQPSGQQPSYGPSQTSGQQPSYGPSQPSGQQPSYGPSQPSGQQPSYGPSQPSGQQPSYGPSQSQGYPGNPWLGRTQPDSWQQSSQSEQVGTELTEEEPEVQQEEPVEEIQNPWNLLQNIPASLAVVPCRNGDVHRLNDACTSVVICRNQRPQLVQCLPGLTYDRPSDSCKPSSVAEC